MNDADSSPGASDAFNLEAMGLTTAGSRGKRGAVLRSGWGPWLGLTALLIATVAIRLVALDQPIVENYVGRQIPTAMVARNLERGSGFLKPRLDTGPFPNYFLVEAPVYQEFLLFVRAITRLPIDAAGRAASALAAGLAALALFCMVRAWKDTSTALWTVAAFGVLPVTLRYGRSVQPDMFALALVLLGLACWQNWSRGGRWWWLVAGWLCLATGLAARLLFVFVLVACAVLVVRAAEARGRTNGLARGILLLVVPSVVVPAAAWYRHARGLLGDGSHASQGSLVHWVEAISPLNWLSVDTWEWVVRFGLIRAFTPIGVLILGRCLYLKLLDRFWVYWILGACATLVAVSGKLHHEYYWLMLAPPVAVACGTLLARFSELAAVERRGPVEAVVIAVVLAAVSVVLAWSTWKTPDEWTNIRAVAKTVQSRVEPDELLIAREALLFYADRRGYRLETEPESIRRAMEEWGATDVPEAPSPADLVSVYDRGVPRARFIAESGAASLAFYRSPALPLADLPGSRVLVNEPGFLLIERPRIDR